MRRAMSCAAADFMPAAGRNRMLRAIDRWMIGATVAYLCEERGRTRLREAVERVV